ncbi:hypothetical protein RISK_001015 [Rhodopirellula islandica]|uniref:Uncharacterized protein n=1 Tax=Rhodopirellula islandica TaxID=595434 RepID=A0A0J1ENZ7_RHOIS|nr:hypothetical protein RISK_001015 [Rhodopirellula islandica]
MKASQWQRQNPLPLWGPRGVEATPSALPCPAIRKECEALAIDRSLIGDDDTL